VISELAGFSREKREHRLRDFLGSMAVTADLPQSRRVDQGKVPVHERGE
jgi:hypothetical protein